MVIDWFLRLLAFVWFDTIDPFWDRVLDPWRS